MGGLAIKNAYTRRYSKQEYNEILPEIIEKAKTLFTDARDTRYYFIDILPRLKYVGFLSPYY